MTIFDQARARANEIYEMEIEDARTAWHTKSAVLEGIWAAEIGHVVAMDTIDEMEKESRNGKDKS